MKYSIDEDICTKYSLDLPSVFAVLIVKSEVDIEDLFNSLIEKEVFIKGSNGDLHVTPRWDDVVSSILLESDAVVPKVDRITALAETLMGMFPTGKKPGTSLYWRGNKKDTILKLQKFFKLYGESYSDEQIINATKSYVESFNGDYSFMRVLKYFIIKSEVKINEDGRGSVEQVSDLASYIENEGQDSTTNNNWEVELK